MFTKISLYIHIPFCTSKCNYCDFYSEVNKNHKIEQVIDKIIWELDRRLRQLSSPVVDTVFIGGGTPSVIPNNLLEKLYSAIREKLDSYTEWTVEANPETVTKEFLELSYKYGITRLSIGVQSFKDRLLKVIGRNCNRTVTLKALRTIKKYWKREFSLDLICSLPGQTLEDVKEDISEALSYNPDHISFYSLILEENTPLEELVSRGVIEELPEELSDSIWIEGIKLLSEAGYCRYEVSNFYKTNPSYHNINYWELKPYLGIGPGAVSTLTNPDGEILRISEPHSIEKFISENRELWELEHEKLSPKEFLKDYIIMGLRLKEGINRSRFKKVFSKDIVELIPLFINLNKDLYINLDTHISFTDIGYNTMNNQLIKILEEIEQIKNLNVNWYY